MKALKQEIEYLQAAVDALENADQVSAELHKGLGIDAIQKHDKPELSKRSRAMIKAWERRKKAGEV